MNRRGKAASGNSNARLMRLYGRQPVLEALKLGLVQSVEVAHDARGPNVTQILRLAEDSGVPVHRVSVIADSSGNVAQGVRALALPPSLRHDLREFAHSLPASPSPLVLMLDGIHDPHNFGAILRTAECAGANAVVIRKRRQVQVTEAVVKASAGAAYNTHIFQVVNLSQALQVLTDAGFWSVVALAEESAMDFRDYDWSRKTVLILGAEGPGVSDLLRRRADACVRIPLYGRIASLNVSVAAGVLLFEAARKRFAT